MRIHFLLKKLIPSDWHDYFEKEWDQILQGHLSPIYDYQIIHKTQGLRWLNQRNVGIRNAAGELVAIEGIVTDRTVQKHAEQDLWASQQRFLKILDSIDAAVNVVDMETHEVLFVNRYMRENFGGDMTGDACWAAFRNEKGPRDACTHARLVDANGKPTGVCVWKDRNPVTGKYYVNHDRAVEWTDGRLVRLQIATDITDLTRMEHQLQQAQKMESVGRLAGGVAHDYNNMLSVILGYTELALDNTAPEDPLYSDLQEIHAAAMRSIKITRQLLAFSRKQTIAPRRLELNETVEGMLKMLRRLVGENIDIVWHPGSRIDSVYMDPSQIDQILVNLCINARDAIFDVGKITIETTTQSIDDAYCADHADAVPGDFIMLAVSDDGCGMDKEVQARLFEPFFTTKELGKGTGLGLATIYGIVRQNNGFINVYSEPGEGTTFRIYLPRYESAPEPVERPTALPSDAKGTETILLVEDEHTILRMTQMMLKQCGYTVLTANNAAEAMDVARGHAGPIHLIMTDVVMPDMNGKALSIRIQELYAGVKVLFMSGYTANVIAHRGVLDEGIDFIQKPFSRKDLAAKVREVLDGA
ncbi:hybrid sensor histidine kinase/response regulator [Desulfosarcina cetonica]|uniref:hybrid sensor histidine kinase/response regulator n=1 Tax=Desulfosarcina cetonica TaxID=90730 RepID=UPI0006D17C2E|nr:ATP-binding protein [Desulfosarcina cetonica]